MDKTEVLVLAERWNPRVRQLRIDDEELNLEIMRCFGFKYKEFRWHRKGLVIEDPQPLTSLDHAMLLIPSNCFYFMAKDDDVITRVRQIRFTANVWRKSNTYTWSYGINLAHAFTVAALKFRCDEREVFYA
jgi:hypothetical protein